MPPRRRLPHVAPPAPASPADPTVQAAADPTVQPAADPTAQPAVEAPAGSPADPAAAPIPAPIPAPSPPPHLAALTLDYATDERFVDFHRAAQRGFQEESPDSVIEFDRQVHEPDRSFGYRVGERWVSTFGAFTRTLVVPGGARVPVAAVTAVTVTAPYRRRGLLSRMMAHQFEDSLRRGEPLAALWASESVIYGRFGYGQAAPRLRLGGNTRSTAFLPEVDLGDGSVDEVTREQFLAMVPPIREAATAGRAGTLDRPAKWWPFAVMDHEHWRAGATSLRYVVHYRRGGEPSGYATYRVKDDYDIHGPRGEVQIGEVEAVDAQGYARLWRYLFDLDLVRTFRLRNAALDEPVRYLLADPRAIHAELLDGLHLRILDVRAALSARRYAGEVDVVIRVVDGQLDRNAGTFRLAGGPDGATVRAARRGPDLTIGVRELGTVYLGGTTVAQLQAAGLVVEHRAGSVARMSAAFRGDRAPFCADGF